MDKKPVVTRFPPSPTGYMHIGRARTALFNYLFTQKHKKAGLTSSKMVFRIEDTDKERSKPEFETNIVECLKWLGISYDEGPHRQSERTEVYKKYLKQMVDSGHAYVSKEEPTEEDRAEGRTRTEVIRFKNPNKKITFNDLIRGEITFDTSDLKDFVIARSMEEPLYHLAVVVDDFEMGVTHILRGEDGISNTPRQILIQEAIGAPRPVYAHIPLILAPDRSKLSGRHGAVSVTDYRDKGYLPEALINYLALLGWNPGTDQEIFSMDELIEKFDIAKVQKAGAIFNIEKLNWVNKEYIKKLPIADLEKRVTDTLRAIDPACAEQKEMIARVTPLVIERINTLGEIKTLLESGDFMYFFKKPSYDASGLLWKDEKDPQAARGHLEHVIKTLEGLAKDAFNQNTIKEALWPYATEKGRGNVLWPMRFALSGVPKSPDPFVLADILGKDETLARIKNAIHALTTLT